VPGARCLTFSSVAILYRCKTPTNYLCRCGAVARRLKAAGIEYDEVRVGVMKRDRPEIEELTGQRWVPVLVHGEEVIHDSRRIVEYIEWVSSREQREAVG
jgi:glutathione S-transferase